MAKINNVIPMNSAKHSSTSQPLNTESDIAAYILAGGESRRFGGQTKGMQTFKGYPLIAHCIARLTSQVESININTHLPDFSAFNYPIVGDDPDNLYQGPLSGLLASMQHFHEHYPEKNWLLLAPCDSPFAPKNFVHQLLSTAHSEQSLAACISYQHALQPTFSIWHKSLLPSIKDAVHNKKWGGLKIFFQHLGESGSVVEYPEQEKNPFLNINNKDELAQAQLS